MTSSSRRRLTVTVARLVGGAAIAVALAPAVQAADSYGAIAYAPNGMWGRSHGTPAKEDAEAAAVKSCGSTECKVMISFTGCGAVATKGGGGDTEYQAGTGPDLRTAMKEALGKLPGGYIDTWSCN
ncbi:MULTISPECIES: DUF4189 domain-containing protein [Mycobacterium]|uniref:DUF4189 domain-containing protein n=1 Tax=Mycobacterium kiyosense TaxID=2871094 RepID=A0A9P3Q661_9MYCO|nr:MULTISPECIES: DUF4189 domain-containing protein [Mycobacterium]BDB43912.1 hypothetical protein IWGMT90018_43580 [Mycobacterium kiyosense]BDE15467.1 hypothetical protein MKCMC460_43270 [Mycobacterium sp. 20KCMC460]GLB81108.1 hypothetical protein SRL2020028_03640 [Mycobacterium kiyosense]GLB90417.1 hypothetical protein SRL2020130_32340 [Mycobacterium kiyosense]GLB93589.1 hypothetical protein SRL2020226_03650 [Mycobacterium kiyosense]